MEPPRAGVRERLATATGSSGERGLALEVALLEPDHATAAQVDRGQDVEPACHGTSVLAF